MPKYTPFPNLFADLTFLEAGDRDIKVVEGYIDSALKNLRIPHVHEGKLKTEGFFIDLCHKASELTQEVDPSIQIDLYIAGGVVRALLAQMYQFLYEHSHSVSNQPAATSNELNPELDEVVRDKWHSLVHGSELRLRQYALINKTPLYSPLVLSVNGDLDIYYEIKCKEGNTPPTAEQLTAGDMVAKGLDSFINHLPRQHVLNSSEDPMRHSFMPIADIREYNVQMNEVMAQGGSMLDTLAFKLNANKDEPRLRHPDKYAVNKNIIRDFFKGMYEYVAPQPSAKPRHPDKQKIRGVRSLLQLPFITIKDDTQIKIELNQMLVEVKDGKFISHGAIEQFKKLIQNANLQGAGNRAYLDTESSLHIALQIADILKTNGMSRNHLLPEFLLKLPILIKEEKQRVCKGNLYQALSNQFISLESFRNNYTENGKLYHGTEPTAAICILRNGFIASTARYGRALYGPGFYMSRSASFASNYIDQFGIVLPLQLVSSEEINILSRVSIKKHHLQLLEEAQKKGFQKPGFKDDDAIYALLRDRNEYAIDIVVAEQDIVVIQNQNVIDLTLDLKVVLQWYEFCVQTTATNFAYLHPENILQDYFNKWKKSLETYQYVYTLLSQMGCDLAECKNVKTLAKDSARSYSHLKNKLHRDLMLAIQNENIEKVRTMIECGSDVNKSGKPLNAAAALGNIPIASLLLAHGAEIDARDQRLNTTPLLRATFNCHAPMALFLIEKGANLDTVGYFNGTALRYAMTGKMQDVMVALLEKGASPIIKDEQGLGEVELTDNKKSFELYEVTQKPINMPAFHEDRPENNDVKRGRDDSQKNPGGTKRFKPN